MYLDELWKKESELINKEVSVHGWVKTNRNQKDFGFIDFSDGTSIKHLQLVYDKDSKDFDGLTHLKSGAAIEAVGTLIKSVGSGQDVELKVKSITLLGDVLDDYPLQPKRHSPEFLRSIAYLRPRANMFQAVFRIRSVAAMGIHEYFQSHGYVYAHTPLLTTADCEGSDQMIKVTTLDMNNLPRNDEGVDYSKDLFGKPTFITGSGQLQGEAFASAFSKIYTFGPTFRTENSNTKTHANEFWMIEPEIQFCDLNELMNIEEEMLKYVVNYVLSHASLEIDFCDKYIEKGLRERLQKLVDSKFVKITHKEAIDLLLKADKKWEFEPSYQEDIAKEHERYITDYYHGPVFVYDWPKDIKAWYMRVNDDNKTVAAVDLIVPGSGELMGGSQREERLDVLTTRMKEMGIDEETVYWYVNLRRYGGAVHSGYGLGFERLIMYLTGVDNIRDVIAFPRTPGVCDY